MNVNSLGSVTIAGVVVLESPQPINPQKGPRNVVFDVNLCIVEGSQTVTMALLRCFAPSEMTNEIQAMADKDFQKAFVVTNIETTHFLFKMKKLIHFPQIASVTPNSISPFMSGFEISDYAFVGDIYQVKISFILYSLHSHNRHFKLIPSDGDASMETNPYITMTGTVTKFNSGGHTFTMTPLQYVVLTHTTSPFPIHVHFADSNSKKRWGAEGPRVAIGSSITLGGSLQ